jgi:hypothetical protein
MLDPDLNQKLLKIESNNSKIDFDEIAEKNGINALSLIC